MFAKSNAVSNNNPEDEDPNFPLRQSSFAGASPNNTI